MWSNYLLKKALSFLASLSLIVTLTFFLMHAIPGDPLMQEKAIPEEIMQSLRKYYGLDQPLHAQFVKYVKGVLSGDLGPSFKYEGRSVNEIIRSGFPVSCYLGLEALLIAVGGGILLGSIAALHHRRLFDRIMMVVAVIGISVPSFVLATFLQYGLAVKLSLLPIARWGSFSHTLMPALSLAALPLAFIARLTRSNMIEVLGQDYILTAKSKGLSETQVLLRHVMRNALLPIVAYLGPLSAAVLTGSFAIEKIFGIPGLGQWFVSSITNRDYTVIMGVTLFYGALLLLCVFITDLLYSAMDPRIQRGVKR